VLPANSGRLSIFSIADTRLYDQLNMWTESLGEPSLNQFVTVLMYAQQTSIYGLVSLVNNC